ncbi:MAG: tetratricopeptide repeat protein [Planctomycetota bacterium]|jgi:tetratricopeptide (TPR) repeat protein
MTVREFSISAVCLLLFGLCASAHAGLSSGDAAVLFRQANEAFEKANLPGTDPNESEKLYEKAILSFERIINEVGIKNARLYYNLGNTYLLKGDIGRSILNYRRAERLDSADPDIQKNLAFARSRRVDIVNPRTEKRVMQTLFFWHYDFSLKTRFILTCIFFAVVCISLTAIVWLGRSAAVTVTLVICAVLTVCSLVSVVLETHRRARQVCGVIIAKEVIAHQADWENSPASFKEPLHAGTEFDLIERRGKWLHIALDDGSDGWIPENGAETI